MPRKTPTQNAAGSSVVQLRPRTQEDVLIECDARVEEAAADIARMEEIVDGAQEGESWGPAATAAGKLPGLRAVQHRLTAAREAERAPDVLARIRVYRSAAAAEGSWTAVASLTAQEREIEREDAARRQEEEERKRLSSDPVHVLTQLEGALRQLPEGLAHDLRERLKWT
jgi:hypothetical protein